MRRVGCALGFVVLALVFTGAPAHAQEFTISVAPDTGLTDGQVVSVSGSGFPDDPLLPSIVQCSGAVGTVVDITDRTTLCDAMPFIVPTIDAAGNYEASFPVNEVISVGFGTIIDCTVEQCVIVAGSVGGPNGFTGAAAPIRFGPTTPQTMDDCRNGGWRNFTDDDGRPFRNQGQCARFVATRG